MSEWQPIETAPKNTPVLVWAAGARHGAEGNFRRDDLPIVAVCEDENAWYRERNPLIFREEKWRWRGDLVEFESGWESTGSYTITLELAPTHWLPLPEAPK